MLEKYLQRETSGRSLIQEIDGFRFFAIGTVLLYHLNTHVSRTLSDSGVIVLTHDNGLMSVISKGSLGVDVFFAISGFILALPFARHHLFNENPVSLRAYYVKRLTRLEPPYVVSLVLFLLVHLFILHENFGNIFPHFLASLFYLHSIVYDAWSTINPVTWSLEVEVQFYLLAPVLARIFMLRSKILRRSILVMLIIVSIFHVHANMEMIEALHLRKSLLVHLHQFLVGFLFADLFLTDWREALKYTSFVYDGIGLIALGLLFVLNVPYNPFADGAFNACVLVAFVALFKGKMFNAFFTNRWIVIIGGMCYSIYLLHYALIALLTMFSIKLFNPEWSYAVNYGIQALVIVPVVLLVSAVFFALIEKPCMRKDWPARLYAKAKAIFV